MVTSLTLAVLVINAPPSSKKGEGRGTDETQKCRLCKNCVPVLLSLFLYIMVPPRIDFQ